MALMAGRALFGTWDITIHGWVGNGIFVLVVANLALALYTRAGLRDLGLAVALFALTFAQIGLGYVGRDTLEAAAWHVPNGVLLMAISTFQYAALRFAPTAPAERPPGI